MEFLYFETLNAPSLLACDWSRFRECKPELGYFSAGYCAGMLR